MEERIAEIRGSGFIHSPPPAPACLPARFQLDVCGFWKERSSGARQRRKVERERRKAEAAAEHERKQEIKKRAEGGI